MHATISESTITVQLTASSEPKPRPLRIRCAEVLGWYPRSTSILTNFLEAVEEATRRDEIHNLLLHASQLLTGAPRVEVRPVGGTNRVLTSRSRFHQAADAALEFPIRYRKAVLGTLLVSPSNGRKFSPSIITDLETLCSIAAIGDRLLGREQHLRISLPTTSQPNLKPNSLLSPYLRQLLLLARRRREPLGVLAIDLQCPAYQLDPENLVSVDRAEPIITAVVSTLRESDLVVQYDAQTLIAVLPNASMENVSLIAESVARSIYEVSGSSQRSANAIGLASFPDDAREADVLLDVALDALRRSRDAGLGKIFAATRAAFTPRFLEDVATNSAS